MRQRFEDYFYHDVEIKVIRIDRSNPGHNDTIIFEIVSPDNEKQKAVFKMYCGLI